MNQKPADISAGILQKMKEAEAAARNDNGIPVVVSADNNEKLHKKEERKFIWLHHSKVKPFHSGLYDNGQPFELSQDKLDDLRPSIKDHGIITPCVVRYDPEYPGCFEMIAGHHRLKLAEEFDLSFWCELDDLDNDTARIYVVDTNIQDGLTAKKPSEICKALNMRKASTRHQGKRSDISKNDGFERESKGILCRSTENRYCHLIKLIPELMKKTDEQKITVRTAYHVSFLDAKIQTLLYEFMDTNKKWINEDQADKLKKHTKDGGAVSVQYLRELLCPSPMGKKKTKLSLPQSVIKKHIPDADQLGEKEITNIIIDALKSYFQTA